MDGAVIFLLVALVAGPVVNATTLFPNRIHPSLYSPRRDAYPWAYRWKYPGAYPDAGFQGGFPQPLQGGYYRDELYDRQRSGLGRPVGPTLLPQYDPYYAGPGNSYLHGAQFDLFDTQAQTANGNSPRKRCLVKPTQNISVNVKTSQHCSLLHYPDCQKGCIPCSKPGYPPNLPDGQVYSQQPPPPPFQ